MAAECGNRLKIEQLAVVLRELKDLGLKKTHSLGLYLGVPKATLEEYEDNHPRDVRRVRTETVTYWLKNHPECTWNNLCEALYEVDEANLGRTIRDKFVLNQPQDPRKPQRGVFMGFKEYYTDLKCCREAAMGTEDSESTYFKPLPASTATNNAEQDKENLKIMKAKMRKNFQAVEAHQKAFKVGYEARFGQIYWQLSERDVDDSIQDKVKPNFFTSCDDNHEAAIFMTRTTCDPERLFREKCESTSESYEWQVDPLKFKVTGPAHEGITYIAVVTNMSLDSSDGKFVLCEVYWRKDNAGGGSPPGVTLDIVLPGKKHDIRIADCCAPVLRADDEHVRSIADKLARSIHVDGQTESAGDTFSMILRGEDFNVQFFRYKKLQQHPWKDHPEWILAEYDVQQFEMTPERLEDLAPNKHTTVEFNDSRKEIELWSQKIFPEDYSLTHPRTSQYAKPKATGMVRLPRKRPKPATDWTADQLLLGFEKFVQAAASIVDILEDCPPI